MSFTLQKVNCSVGGTVDFNKLCKTLYNTVKQILCSGGSRGEGYVRAKCSWFHSGRSRISQGRQLVRGKHQPNIWPFFPQKLHENEEILAKRRAHAPCLFSCNFSENFAKSNVSAENPGSDPANCTEEVRLILFTRKASRGVSNVWFLLKNCNLDTWKLHRYQQSHWTAFYG